MVYAPLLPAWVQHRFTPQHMQRCERDPEHSLTVVQQVHQLWDDDVRGVGKVSGRDAGRAPGRQSPRVMVTKGMVTKEVPGHQSANTRQITHLAVASLHCFTHYSPVNTEGVRWRGVGRRAKLKNPRTCGNGCCPRWSGRRCSPRPPSTTPAQAQPRARTDLDKSSINNKYKQTKRRFTSIS